jgi:hypothetical protein
MKITLLILALCTVLNSYAQKPRLLIPFRAGNLWGYADTSGKIMIRPQFSSAGRFLYEERNSAHRAVGVAYKNKKAIGLDDAGKTILPPLFDSAVPFFNESHPAFYVRSKGKWGIYGEGKRIVALLYDSISYLQKDRPMEPDTNLVILNKDGKQGILIPGDLPRFFNQRYDIVKAQYNNPSFELYERYRAYALIVARLHNKYGLIDEQERIILPFIYDDMELERDYVLITRGDRQGFYKTSSVRPAIDPKYDKIIKTHYYYIDEGIGFYFFEVEHKGKKGYVGENGVEFFRDYR